jgi:hypothetical protein
MTITLDLKPEIERGLLAQAQARGVSLKDYVQEIVAREVHVQEAPTSRQTGQELIDICARVRGLADDLDTTRNPSTGRPVDLS